MERDSFTHKLMACELYAYLTHIWIEGVGIVKMKSEIERCHDRNIVTNVMPQRK